MARGDAYSDKILVGDDYFYEDEIKQMVARIAELEKALDRCHLLSMEAQAELDNGDVPEVNGYLVKIAETAHDAKTGK